MFKWRFKLPIVMAAGVGVLGALVGDATPGHAEEITIVSWGGSFQAAQRKVYFEPFQSETGITIREDEYSTGGLPALEAQVQSGKVQWDVLDLGMHEVVAGCEKGLLEPLDIGSLGGADRFLDGAVYECGIQTTVAGFVPTYNAERFPGEKPQTLADFWDVEKFPGKRGLRKRAWQTLEVALIADGVDAGEVYDVLGTPAGLERALSKLDEVKADAIWWSGLAQARQMLLDGEVAMTFMPNARVIDAAKTYNKPLVMIWDGAAITGDIWAVAKDAPNREAALEFIRFVNRDDIQMEWPKVFRYGPPLKSVIANIPEDIGREMVTHPDNQKNSFVVSAEFWADNLEDYAKRFNAWLAE